MPLLNLEQIKRDGQDRIEFVDAMETLQGVVDRLYPGHKVVVISPDEIAPGQSTKTSESGGVDFRSLTGVQQMEAVLNEKPMTARELFAEIQRRGAVIPMSTVQSTLSRKKTIFRNRANGIWSAIPRPRFTGPPGAIIASSTNGAH